MVFQGNEVRDEQWNYAVFADLGSAPATMQAAKACDAYGLLAGHCVEQCDAEQAYVQSKLLGAVPTWVRLPQERWPASWAGMKDPVCPLVLALDGRPDAGTWWEQQCDKRLQAAGFPLL